MGKTNKRLVSKHIKIETYWNVNQAKQGGSGAKVAIKIETYWNVNYFSACFLLLLPYIKIETYWNVNVFEEHNEESFDELK